jgi:hypothetical protein
MGQQERIGLMHKNQMEKKMPSFEKLSQFAVEFLIFNLISA